MRLQGRRCAVSIVFGLTAPLLAGAGCVGHLDGGGDGTGGGTATGSGGSTSAGSATGPGTASVGSSTASTTSPGSSAGTVTASAGATTTGTTAGSASGITTGSSTSAGSATGGTCLPSQTNCDGACVDTDTNPQHCGACGASCGAPGSWDCVAGACVDARMWSGATLVEMDPGDTLLPSVAVSPGGIAFVVWLQQGNGTNYDVRAARYAGDWGSAETIEAQTEDTAKPQVAVDPQGNVIAVWGQSSMPKSIWVNRYSAAASAWLGAVKLSGNVADGIGSVVAMGPDGNGIVLWLEGGNVQGRRFAAGIWENVQTVASGGGPSEVRVGMDAAGNALAVWRAFHNGQPSLWSNRFEPGPGWDTAQPIENDANAVWIPDLAVNADGDGIAVWRVNMSGTLHVWSNAYTAGQGWGTAALVEMDAMADAREPRVAMDAAGNAFAVWLQSSNGKQSVWANRYVPGQGWGTRALVETDDTYAASEPRVGVDAAGNAVAIWVQSDGASDKVWSNRYRVADGAWGMAERIENVAGDASFPEVAVSDGGVAVAVWQKLTGAVADVYANVLK